jgi:predicted metal-dependent phosphoesterase TrpH
MAPIFADLHCHTSYSKDCLLKPSRLLELCRRRGIDRLAITDHNTIRGALETAALDPERVIVGEEIMTTCGELLAYYVQEEVPPGLTPEETIRRLRLQGAVVSVSHPFDGLRAGAWAEEELDRILGLVDAIEVFNARVASDRANRKAAAIAQGACLPGTAGSDAHSGPEVGRAGLRLPAFADANGLRAALGEAEVVGHRSSYLVHLLSRYASIVKRVRRKGHTGEP